MLNSPNKPCKSLLYHAHHHVFCHLHNNRVRNICHLPLHLFCSLYGPRRTSVHRTNRGKLVKGLQSLQTTATLLSKEKWCEMKSKESQPLWDLQKASALLVPWNSWHIQERKKPSKISVLRHRCSSSSHSNTLPSPQALNQRLQHHRRLKLTLNWC